MNIDFVIEQENIQETIQKVNGMRSSINNVILTVRAEFLSSRLSQNDWESFFGGEISNRFDTMPIGHRPDTVILKNLPARWIGVTPSEDPISVPESHPLYQFFSQFGAVRYLLLL